MKIKSIYPARNSSQLREVLGKYSPGELLYAPIDVAKYNHKASCAVNFFGDILTPAFKFSNNAHGVKFFISKITEAARNAKAKKIFIGLEATGHYHQNLTLHLVSSKAGEVHPLQVYRLYEEIIFHLEKEIAYLLVQTPGTYLLSVPGISVTYAAEVTAEIGDISRFAYANQIISLAGTCSKKDQTGEHDPQNLPISKKGNKFLRTVLDQAGLSLNTWCPDFNAYYSRKVEEKKDRKGIARTATGNKFARLAFALMKHESLYHPRSFNTLVQDPGNYYLSVYGEILKKLRAFSSEKILPQNNYLEKIKQKLEKEYAINLPEVKG